MSEKQEEAREFIDANLRDAAALVDDVRRLLRAAGLPRSPELNGDLDNARGALTAAQRTFADLVHQASRATADD